MAEFDVIVSGAGPAGSTAARECAARGLRVLLLERAEFPRDKPCGGGVTVRAARLLPFDVLPVTERVAFGLRLTVRGRHPLLRYSSQPLTYLTQRRRLDAFLAERAVQAGAVLRERLEVRAVERENGTVLVRAGSESFRGRVLVAADGVNGRTARLAGIEVRRRLTVALEGNVVPPGGVPAAWRDALGLDAGEPRGGYGWIFPKGDHLNVGVAAWPSLGASLRTRLAALTRAYGFDPAHLQNVRGYHLPARLPGSPLVSGNVVLAGDAAGFVDPFSLEGIHSAFWSGRSAAAHVAAYLSGEVTDLDGYRRDVERVLQPELDIAAQIYDLSWLVGWDLWLAASRRVPRSSDLLWRLLRGEQTYTGVRRRLGRLAPALDLASSLVRTVPPLRARAYEPEGGRHGKERNNDTG